MMVQSEMMQARVIDLTAQADISTAAELSAQTYLDFRSALPFLPQRSESDFRIRIEAVVQSGVVMGLIEADNIVAFLGAAPIENYRNAGLAAFGADSGESRAAD